MWKESTATPGTALTGSWQGRQPATRRRPGDTPWSRPRRTAQFTIHMGKEDKARFRAAAKDAGESMAAWIVRQCRAALQTAAEDPAQVARDAEAAQRNYAKRAARAQQES